LNYKRIYDEIVRNRLSNPIDGYSERHHIIPKSLGGSDDESNLVDLTAREHFICHYLLMKMYPKNTNEWFKMTKAFMMMRTCSSNQQRYFNSRLYESQKIHFSKVQSKCQSGKGNSQYGTMWIHNPKTLDTKKIKKNEKIPEGWVKGKFLSNEELKMSLSERKRSYRKRIRISKIKKWVNRFKVINRKNNKRKKDIEKWKPIYEDYIQTSFDYVKTKYELNMKHSAFTLRIQKLFGKSKNKTIAP
jgi:hypothetical protein